MTLGVKTNKSGLQKRRRKKRKKGDKHQDAEREEKYKMKMKLPSPLKDFMSLMNRISFQNNVLFLSAATMHKQATTLDQFKTSG